MKRNLAVAPSAFDRLEPRIVLSHSHLARGASVVVSGLNPGQQVLSPKQMSVVAEVNQAFASFSSDYASARSTYFSSIANNAAPTPATVNAFSFYTKQRVSLLANQVISSFLQSSLSTVRTHGQPNTLTQLVSTKIVTPQGKDPAGSLASSLLATIPPAGTSAPTASLYSLSQDNAIESARISIINGVNIIRNGDFGNKSSKHH